MAHVYHRGKNIRVPASSRSRPTRMGGVFAVQRAPTDAYFYGTLTLQNVIAGSRYWVARASDLSVVLGTGVAAGGDIELAGLPAYANPMLMKIRIRNASGTPAYKPVETYAYLIKAGVTIYIEQQLDE